MDDRLALGSFLGAVVVGGSNYVGVRFSNRELDPLWGAGLRFALAAGICWALCVALRLSLPRGRALRLVALYGVLGFGAAYGCMYWALQEVPAGIAAVVFAVGPLLTLLLAVAHGMERLGVRPLIGAVVALVGSVVMFFQPEGSSFGVLSLALLLVAALGACEATIVSKRAGLLHPLAMNAVAMPIGAVALLVGAAVAGETFAFPRQGETQLALAYLVFATVALFVFVLVVVQRWSASRTAYVFVLMPVVAIAAGALLAGEEITATTLVGGAIVCAGVYVGALSRRRPART
ncbi:MAG TPA: EamA family transporter [Gaiellaceae bacterium]|nr:EamA family transporter [Gaiellaceae bacterium]